MNTADRPPHRPILGILGGIITVSGTIAPWTTMTPPPALQHGLDSVIRLLSGILGGCLILTTICTIPRQRIITMVLGLASAFWAIIGSIHGMHGVSPSVEMGSVLPFARGWYLTWIGILLVLVVSSVTPLWHITLRSWYPRNPS